MLQNRLKYLLDRQLQDSLTETEQQELDTWDQLLEEQEGMLQLYSEDEQLELKQQLWNRINIRTNEQAQIISIPPAVHRIHFLKTAWFRYAAAGIIVIAIGAYLWNIQQKEKPSVTQTSPVPVQNDVAPGGNRATLTLADGSKIVLDSAANGKLADQGTSVIEKKDGQVVYLESSPSTFEKGGRSDLPRNADRRGISYNTMSTPRGGQYQLTLPDGSHVWLNAESSITYPTEFTGSDRKVSISGEAYFEVAKNKAKPFKVTISPAGGGVREANGGGLEIEVLGTHFNVNAYADEVTIKTTLIEGSVRLKTTAVSRLRSPDKSVLTSLTLKPGQQGQLTDQRLSLAVKPDVEQVMAWKNGVFNFNRTSLQEAMRQLSRWYDIEVVYKDDIPEFNFYGEIQRTLTLSQVLSGLSDLGVTFTIERNKRLVVAMDEKTRLKK